MRLPGVYRMSDDEIVKFLVESNTKSDNHFMKFIYLFKTIWYPIILNLSSIRRVFFPILCEGC